MSMLVLANAQALPQEDLAMTVTLRSPVSLHDGTTTEQLYMPVQATDGTGDVTFQFQIKHAFALPCNAVPGSFEYRVNNGSWNLINDADITGPKNGLASAIDLTGPVHTLTWDNSKEYIDNAYSANVQIRFKVNDGTWSSDYGISPLGFNIDNLAPLGLADLTTFPRRSRIECDWTAVNSEPNWSHYEIWYGENQADVENRQGTAIEWDVFDDPNMTNMLTAHTRITGLNPTTTYYVKIWAIDTFGNERTLLTNTVNTLGDGTVAISAGTNNPPNRNVSFAGRDVPMIQLKLEVGPAEDVQITSITFNGAGTADEVAHILAAGVKLYNDTNGDGRVNVGEPLLGTSVYNADNGQVTFAVAETVPCDENPRPYPTTKRNWLLAYDLAGDLASIDKTMQAIFQQAADITVTGVESSANIVPTGTFPISGGVMTLRRTGTVLVELGENNPPDEDILNNAQDLVMIQLKLTETSGYEAMNLDDIRITASGTAHDTADITGVNFYFDENGDGVIDPGDVHLGAGVYDADDGTVFKTFINRFVPAGSVKYLIVSYNLRSTASANETMRCSLVDRTNIEFLGRTSAAYIYGDGVFPLDGNTKTFISGELDATLGPANPLDSQIADDVKDEVMMQLRLTEITGVEMVTLNSLTFRASGTGNEATAVSQIKIYYDMNSNGGVDATDWHIATKTFTSDDETITVNFLGRNVPAGGIRDFLIVYDFNGNAVPGDTFQIHIDADTDIKGTGIVSLLPIPVNGVFPFDGPVKTVSNVPSGRLYLAEGANNPVPSNIRTTGSDIPMLQYTFAADATEDIEVNDITFTHSGSGTPAAIGNLKIYIDNDQDGKLTVGDTLIGQSNVWTGNENTVTFGVPETITAGAPAKSYIVVYDFNGTAAIGNTFFCSIAENNRVNATGVLSTVSIGPLGTYPIEGPQRKVWDRGTLDIRQASTLISGNVVTDEVGVRMLHLAWTADLVEDIDMNSMTITHAGTGTPATDLAQVRIFIDVDKDGQLDEPGDTLIGQSNAWVGNSLTIPLAYQVPQGDRAELLVIYDFNGMASESETFQASIATTGSTSATGNWSGFEVTKEGAAFPILGPQKMIVPQQGHVRVTLGANNPPDTNTLDGVNDVVMMQVDLEEYSNYENVRFLSFKLKAEGTGNEATDLGKVDLFFDENDNGVYDTGDVYLDYEYFTADDGTINFTMTNRLIPKGTTKHLVIMADITKNPSKGETFQFRLLDPADIVLRGQTTGIDVDAEGVFPFDGSTFTIVSGEISAAAGENNPGPQSVCVNAANVPALQLKLTETTGYERVTFRSLTITGSGTGHDQNDILTVSAYFDNDGDGTISDGDVHLGNSTFNGDDGTATFNFWGRYINASETKYVLIVYTFKGTAEANETFMASLAAGTDISATGTVSTETIIPTGAFPIDGGLITMAIDPSGIVYDSLTGEGIAGASVALYVNDPITYPATGWGLAVPGVHIAAVDVNPVLSSALPVVGSYAFQIAAGWLNTDFRLEVTPPAGSGYVFPSTVIPVGSRPYPPGQAASNEAGSHGENFNLGGDVEPRTIHLPLDPEDVQIIRVEKEANKHQAVVGDIITYTLTIENNYGADIDNFNLHLLDTLPAGFKFISESTLIDGVPAADPHGTNQRELSLGHMAANQMIVVSYQLVVGSGVVPGNKYVNKARVISPAGTLLSNVATEEVEITYDPIFDLSIIIGKVFHDKDGDGVQDKDEEGIADVKIATEDGLYVVTDKDGKYHIDGLKPQTKLLKVDPSTLPAGTVFTTENPRVVRLTNGLLAKVNFGVQLGNGDGTKIKKSSEQAPYLEVKVTTEPTMVDPQLNVIHLPATPQFDIEGAALENPIVFAIDTNYSDFIDHWKIEVFSYDNQVIPLKVFEGTRETIFDNIAWNGENGHGLLIEPDETYTYILTVYDKTGHKDTTVEKTVFISSKRSVAREVKVDEIRDELFTNKIATQTIPVEQTGATVKVEGLTVKNARVIVDDHNLGRTTTGKFTKALILPTNRKEVTVIVEDEKTKARSTFTKQLNLSQDYFFLVALGDAEVGKMSASGNIAPVRDNEKFRSGYYFDGRLAYYLKAKVLGKYLITSSFDSDRQKDEMKRFIDPDKYYPVYGDSSSVVDDTNTKGRFYILIEWDKSKFTWGNYSTEINDVELARYNRTLYGAKLRYQSVGTTKYGDPNTVLVGFVAEADTLPAHNEFISTGGSLYFLKHANVVEGSETVTIEVRDKNNGSVLSSLAIDGGADYDIDYDQGRITFYKPVTMIAESEKLVSEAVLLANPVYVVVDYEYQPEGFVEEGTHGARISQQLNDHIKVGATYIKDERDSGYELMGGDVTLKWGKSTEMNVEYAQSESRNAENYVSYDGGLTFTNLPSADDASGNAIKVKIKTDLGELFKKKTNRLLAEAYYQDIDPGFSSQSGASQQGKTVYGVKLIGKLTERDTVTFMYDYQELRSEENLITTNDVGTETVNDYTLQYKHTGQKVTVTGEYKYHDVQGSAGTGEEDETTHTVAARVDYTLNEKAKVYVQPQVTVSGEQDYRMTVGTILELTKQLKVRLQQMVGNKGSATEMSIDTQVDSKTRMYTKYAFGQDDDEGKTSSTTVGSETLIDKDTKLITEQVYKSTDTSTNRSRVIGYEFKKDQWDFDTRLERGEVTSSGVTTERTTLSVAADYQEPDHLKFATKLEFRFDRGDTDKDQVLFNNSLEYKLNQDWTLFARMDYSRTKNKTTGKTETESKEFVLGAALRPVSWDKFNMLMKLSYIADRNPTTQDSNADITEEQAWVFAIEGAYDLTDRLQIVEKFAIKSGTERVGSRSDVTSQTYLWITRVNYHLLKKWDIGLEYRILDAKLAEDQKQGALVEIIRHVNDNVQLGIGYNFTDFNDDLTKDNDYTVKGPFFRMIGKY